VWILWNDNGKELEWTRIEVVWNELER
jgi:hypothetical protein